MVQGFASNGCGCIPRILQKKLSKCATVTVALPVCHRSRKLQAFCQEAVMWKRLTHPNVLPLLGVTIAPLQLVSNWMSGGDLPEYIEKHSNVDRLGLVGDPSVVFVRHLLLLPALRRC